MSICSPLLSLPFGIEYAPIFSWQSVTGNVLSTYDLISSNVLPLRSEKQVSTSAKVMSDAETGSAVESDASAVVLSSGESDVVATVDVVSAESSDVSSVLSSVVASALTAEDVSVLLLSSLLLLPQAAIDAHILSASANARIDLIFFM